jgi:hypothetical protein
MPEQYVATNTSSRSGIGETSSRSVLNIDGTRLHPERTYTFREFTSDILEEMTEDNLRVETESGAPVTIDSLERQGRELKTKTVTERTTNVDGRVDRSHEVYYLEESEETDTVDEEESSEDVVEQDSEEDSEEDSSEEDADEEETNAVIETLKNNGAIPEDAETSSDMNAAPIAKIIRSDIGDRIPDSFFEGETRKTVQAALEGLE